MNNIFNKRIIAVFTIYFLIVIFIMGVFSVFEIKNVNANHTAGYGTLFPGGTTYSSGMNFPANTSFPNGIILPEGTTDRTGRKLTKEQRTFLKGETIFITGGLTLPTDKEFSGRKEATETTFGSPVEFPIGTKIPEGVIDSMNKKLLQGEVVAEGRNYIELPHESVIKNIIKDPLQIKDKEITKQEQQKKGEFVPLAPIPGVTDAESAKDLSKFFSGMFTFGISIAGILAVIMIAVGGIQYMTTDAMSEKTEGKERITYAIMGLLLVLFSWVLLNQINPEILSLEIFN